MRVRQDTYSGVVLETVVYSAPDGCCVKKSRPRIRFKTEEQRIRHREAMARRRHERLFNANFSPSSLYSTLTFDDANEVYTFEDAKRIARNYMRRVQRIAPHAVIFLYMGRGNSTGRIHLHMVSEGLPETVIREKWRFGKIVDCRNLRVHNTCDGVECGQDYRGLANYLFNHWTEEIGGHRFHATRNAKQPHAEEPREIRRVYSEERPPRAPKGYRLVVAQATEFGYLYFRYIFEKRKE